jgi:general secretion pathway protein D
MIQVLMAEVTLNDRFEMGMEFALQDLLFSEHATVQATPNGPIIKGPHFDTVFGTDVGAAGSGSGVNFTVTGEDFNFLFHALQTEGRLEVLSRPSIMVRDNQEANFVVGERVPTVQSITQNANGIITPEVTYEEVGVKLDVTPIINPDGFVNLDVKPEISAIGTSSVTVATGVTLPTFTTRTAETSVTVKDGETIIIGGLITNQENSSETKVPLAGDIPILGWAFRSNSRNTTKTELLIVLTPHVIRDPAQARAVSVHMRDQTGLNDNIRTSPLMQGLQVTPEEDQFGPLEPVKPGSQLEQPAGPRTEEQGPELEEYGPAVGASNTTPAQNDLAPAINVTTH